MHSERDDLDLTGRYIEEVETVGQYQDFEVLLVDDTSQGEEPILEQAVRRQVDVDQYVYTPLEHGPIHLACKCAACRYYRAHGLKHPAL